MSSKVWAVRILVIFAIFIINSCGESPIQKAKDYIEAGMYNESIEHLKEERRNNPTNQEVHYWLGVAHLGIGEEPEARASFDHCYRLDPKTNEAIGDAYQGAGLVLLGQVTPTSMYRGLVYLEEAIGRNPNLKPEIIEACRNRGIELLTVNTRQSKGVLSWTLGKEPSLNRDDSFFYAFYVKCEDSQSEKVHACEEYLSLFPGKGNESEALQFLGQHYYTTGDYDMAKQYFGVLVKDHRDSEAAQFAQERLIEIDDISENISKTEAEKVRAIKQAEIERAEANKNAEIEHARELEKMELETAARSREQELEIMQAQEEAKLRENERRLQETQIQAMFEGIWSLEWVAKWAIKASNRTIRYGKLYVKLSGDQISGNLTSAYTKNNPVLDCPISGTLNGHIFMIKRNCKNASVPLSGVIDVQERTMKGKITHRGVTVDFTGRKD